MIELTTGGDSSPSECLFAHGAYVFEVVKIVHRRPVVTAYPVNFGLCSFEHFGIRDSSKYEGAECGSSGISTGFKPVDPHIKHRI
jgi:hypothetical protein